MKKTMLFLNLFLCIPLVGNMDPKVGFERFSNYYFVGTGTYNGLGISLAQRAGFAEIHVIDNEEKFILNTRAMFQHSSNVYVWHGDTGMMLYCIIKNIDKPITFWLDSCKGFPDPVTNKHTWLLEELEQIKQHPIKTHTILIDDMHCCGSILFDYITKDDLINKIKEINPNYIIKYLVGGNDDEVANNIMLAYVP